MIPGHHIRRAVPADAAALAALGERTFRDTFAADNTPDDLAAHLVATYGPARQAAELADPQWITLVATNDSGELIAFAQLRQGRAPPCVTGPVPIELLRFYVDRGYHGSGVARTLMIATLAAASERGASTIWLGVWERNARAIAFYAKWGFEEVGSHEFILGSDRQTDRIMARWILRATLRPGDLGRIVEAHGVIYAEEHGFDHTFEAYVAEPLGAFAARGSPRERIWIADRPLDDAGPARLAGCVAVAEAQGDVAQLRWFLVHPAARGAGLGRLLLDEALGFARGTGYAGMHLWTVRSLAAARRLYLAAGFDLAESVPARRWGTEVIEERYELYWRG